MAKETSQWALGIGAQSDQATVLAAVRDATDLIVGAATGTDATGILLRSDDDISLSMKRLSEEAGQVPGSLSVLGSVLRSTEPVCSFTIDMLGNHNTAGTPDAGDYDLDPYMLRILEGARLTEGTPASANTPYAFASAQEYQTLKVWRSTESWTMVGCTFNLSWEFVAGEKCRLGVTVFADSVIHDDTEVFPTTTPSAAYGAQLKAAPIFQLAAATLDGVTRGIQSATVSIAHAREQIGDCNVATGIINSEGRRTVAMSGNWYVDTAADDFTDLETDLVPVGASGLQPMVFKLGQTAGAGATVNAFRFSIPNYEYDELGEVNSGDESVRSFTGRGVVAGATGFGAGGDEEFLLESV